MKRFLEIIACSALLLCAVTASAATTVRTIKSVDPIKVSAPVGTAPRLPWQVYVTYSDGTHEWRQVKWTNSSNETEKAEAATALGSTYTVQGYVIGDNTTDYGYPLTADVTVVDGKWSVPSNVPVAQPLPLSKVTITGDNRLTNNRDLDIHEMLKWDVKQQLYNYRDTYGLSTEGYPESDGWDSPDTKLKGHGSGHYMSAMAFAYASAADPEIKAELLSRIKYMVDELRMCQERTFVWSDSLGRYWEARDYAPEEQLRDMKGTWEAFDEYKKDYKHYGYGYLNAIPAAHPALIEMYRAYNNRDWVWAPYYTIHKQLAGLIDIANNVDDKEVADKAFLIAKDMGLWVWNRLHYRTYVKTDGDKAERQAKPGNRYEMWNMYIAGEVGGMAESLSRLSQMASDPTEKAHLLEAANCFDSPAFFDPLSKNIDDIRTRHANQHIPMITGALWSYKCNDNPYYYNIAYNFWNMIQGRYAYAMGGVGNGEMFRQPYSQIISMNTNVESDFHRNMFPNPEINETCCAYNLAKLTKDLNCFNPDDAAYMDYYERVLYNQLVGSVNPEHYATCYQYAVGMNASKPFGNETPQSSCCGGTGAENHVKYQEAAYFVSDNTIWVALYIPSVAQWDAKGVFIEQDCLWPAEKSTITVKGDANFAMKVRIPYWATEGVSVKLNGIDVAAAYEPCSYVEIPARDWKSGDKVEVVIPFTKHINFGPDKMELAATGLNQTRTPFAPMWVGAFMYGPLVMATPDVSVWDQANVELSSDLHELVANAPTTDAGYNGNLYTMSLGTKNFQPDYYETGNSTHYLRINVLNGTKKKVKTKGVDKADLEQSIQIAKNRVADQEAWNALETKVPNFAPWAPHGYARMVEAMQAAEEVAAKKPKKTTQAEVNAATASLNVCINSMRPGNLAEPEDLDDLIILVTDSKENIPNKTTELREAIDFADMVIEYVNDGSGTTDFIGMAVKRLQDARKTVVE